MTSPRHCLSRWFKSLITVLAFLAGYGFAVAAPVEFDIPAQPVPAALHLFMKQSGQKVMFNPADLKTLQTHAVKGKMEPVDALDQLLADTGYKASQTPEGNFLIKKAEATVTTGSVRGSLTGEGGKGVANVLVTIKETADSTETDRYGVFVFPNVAAGTYVLVASAPGYQTMHITDVQVKAGRDLTIGKEEMRRLGEGVLKLEPFVVHADTVEQLEKFIVTDSKPQPFSDRNVDLPRTINDVQPYYIFDSQKIEESGTTSVEDFLRQRLTMDTTVLTNSQTTLNKAGPSGGGNVNAAMGTANTASSINLQGLGADHTLILVNGRPMAGVAAVFTGNGPSTYGQPDVNGIPLAAVDRIEILPSSAGAIYGAGAEGGVINIILKKAYSGGDISATYASTWDGHGPSRTVEATLGRSFNNGKTQLFVTAQYADSSPMFLQDRLALYNRGFSTIFNRDPAFFGYNSAGTGTPFLGAEPNFRSSPAGQTLTFKGTGASFGASFGTVPVGFTALSDPAKLIPGQWNFTPPESNEKPTGLLTALANYPRRKSIMATLTHDLTDKLQLHADYSYNGNHSYSDYNNSPTTAIIPASVPVNPFNQTIFVSFPISNPGPVTSDSITNAIAIGGTLKLPFDWVAHADYQWSRSSYEYSWRDYSNAFSTTVSTPTYGTFSNGVSDPNPTPFWSGVFNPFTDTLANPSSLDPFAQYGHGSSKSTSNDLIVAASGPLAHFSWGEPLLSIRLEHNKANQPGGNGFTTAPSVTPYLGLPDAGGFSQFSFAQSQTVNSANAELDLPIFKTKRPLLRALDLQFNVGKQQTTVSTGTPGYLVRNQYAYYSGTGALSQPGTYILFPNTLSRTVSEPISTGAQPYQSKSKFSSSSVTGPALSYKPFDDLIIRASVASGYIAPTPSQLLPSNFAQTPASTSITDPKNSGVRYNITTYTLGGDPNLKPTTSKSWDFGIVWQPHSGWLKGFRFDAEFVETKQFNQILDPGIQGFINLESLYPSMVVRDPATGLITTAYDKFINVAESKQEAWTFTLDYSWKTAIGSFELSAAQTIQEHNQQQIVADTNFLEYVGYPNAGGVAKTKSTATLRWSRSNWVAAWTVVSFGGYNQWGALGDPGAYATALETGKPYTLNTQYTAAQGSSTIPSQTYHNLYLSYTFKKRMVDSKSWPGHWSDSLLDGVKVSLVVNNVFNTMPALDAFYAPFYISPYGDIQLRNYSITLKKSF